MLTLCTPADLETYEDAAVLAPLFDDVNTPPVWEAGGDAQQLAGTYCATASLVVLSYATGHLDLNDAGVQVLLREYACYHVLWKRWMHRGRFGAGNKFSDAWKSAEQHLKLLQLGQAQLGDPPQPVRDAYVAGGGRESVFGPDADGNPSRFTERW